MTLQTLTLGKQQFVILAKRDFQKLVLQAQNQTEDDYWIQSALAAEAKAKSRNEKPIPFEDIEREIDTRKKSRSSRQRKSK